MLKEKLEPYRLILASQSPRRQLLLKGLDLQFEVITLKDIDESFPTNLKESDVSVFLAKQKAKAYHEIIDTKTIVITADTIVWYNNKVLNKPDNRDEAIKMLSQLSGNMHVVYTGVCITGHTKQCSFYSETKVWFADLSKEEIEYYVDHYKPYDKAGAYGAQEWIGYVAIKKIEGSYFNVMGLPVRQLYAELENFIK
jgi:septum formation protein